MPLPLHRLRVNAPYVASEVIDGEAVLIHFETGSYYSTDQTGAEILVLLQSHAPAEVVAALAARHPAERDKVETAVTDFVTRLQEEALLVPDSSPSVKGESPAPPEEVTTSSAQFQAPVLHKYSDLEDLLRLDPIHDVDKQGWPAARPDSVIASRAAAKQSLRRH